MTETSQEQRQVKKMIPSKLETGTQKFLYRFAKYIPSWVTPNMLTALGGIGGVIAAVSFFMAKFNKWCYIAAILGVLLHIITDDLDGYVARSRRLASLAGAYFDIMVDVLLSTFVLIGLGLSGYIHLEVVIFLVPMYAIEIVTITHNIMHLKEFPFPRFGPIESQLGYIMIAFINMIVGKKTCLRIGEIEILLDDLIMIFGGIVIYIQTFKMQIQLFKRLQREELISKMNCEMR